MGWARGRMFLVALSLSCAGPARHVDTGPSSVPTLQTDEERSAWLREHALAIRSIDANDEDFSDLEPFADVIGDARVVLLGEQTHGEATTFAAKSRLVRFLHQRLQFGVLAFESGMYDGAAIWSNVKAGASARDEAQQSLFYMYAESQALVPLFSYIDQQAKSEHPLALAAIYGSHSGAKSRAEMVSGLAAFMKEKGLSTQNDARWPTLERLSQSLMQLSSEVPSADEQAQFFDTLSAGEGELESLPVAEAEPENERDSVGFWRQIVRSLRSQGQELWQTAPVGRYSVRDAQAAENLLWYAQSFYPKQKLIVWAHNGHVARGFEQLSSPDPDEEAFLRNTVPVTAHLHEPLKDSLYVLAFVGYQGSYSDFEPEQVTDVPKAEVGSLEALWAASGAKYSLLDFKGTTPGGDWLRQHQRLRLGEYMPDEGLFPASVDGLFFIRDVAPAVRQ